MLLTIIIPTYKRTNDLNYNLTKIEEIVSGNGLLDVVDVCISNNASPDNTQLMVEEFIAHHKLHITLYNQSSNIGLEKNALFVLSKAVTPFVMYLGDDDYISSSYLLKVIEAINTIDDLAAIIPSFQTISPDKTYLSYGRDIKKKSRLYQKGFLNAIENSFRGHQLSGLVFRREGLYDSYIINHVANIYPFIYFVTYSCLKGRTLHLTEYPVLITKPGQMKKDWNYGVDGLLSDIFNNYKCLDISYVQRVCLEIRLLYKQSWRFMKQINKPAVWWKSTFAFLKSSNGTIVIKTLFFFIVGHLLLKSLWKEVMRISNRIVKKILKKH